jgi:hypothetical protein
MPLLLCCHSWRTRSRRHQPRCLLPCDEAPALRGVADRRCRQSPQAKRRTWGAILIGAAELDDQEQGFYRGPPFLEQLLGLRKVLDIVRGVLQGDELAAARPGDRIVESKTTLMFSVFPAGGYAVPHDRTRFQDHGNQSIRRTFRT